MFNSFHEEGLYLGYFHDNFQFCFQQRLNKQFFWGTFNFSRKPFLINISLKLFWNKTTSYHTLHKKKFFPLRISSVNVTKSAVSCGWSHLLKKFLIENYIFCVVIAILRINDYQLGILLK